MIVINAVNIRAGGGRVLLLDLLNAIRDDSKYFIYVDSTLDITSYKNTLILKKVSRSFLSRLTHEFRLMLTLKSSDTLLCLNNLPPLFPVRARTFVFLQNRLLVERGPISGQTKKFRLKIFILRSWLKARSSHITHFIVQTESMKFLLPKNIPCSVIPFSPSSISKPKNLEGFKKDSSANVTKTLIYPASPDAHKNHHNLILALRLLHDLNLCPQVLLTIERSDLPLHLQVESNLLSKVHFKGNQNPEDLKKLYAQSDALIFPSLCESFGLPLIEAQCHKIPILAAELDYVRDVCNPVETFDPTSPRSIARAILRWLHIPELPILPVSSTEFLEKFQDLIKEFP